MVDFVDNKLELSRRPPPEDVPVGAAGGAVAEVVPMAEDSSQSTVNQFEKIIDHIRERPEVHNDSSSKKKKHHKQIRPPRASWKARED